MDWKNLFNNLKDPFLWQESNFIIYFCLIVSVVVVVAVVIITNLFRRHRKVMLMPIAFTFFGAIIAMLSAFFADSSLQLIYFGISVYSFWIMVFIGGIEAVLMCIFRMMGLSNSKG